MPDITSFIALLLLSLTFGVLIYVIYLKGKRDKAKEIYNNNYVHPITQWAELGLDGTFEIEAAEYDDLVIKLNKGTTKLFISRLKADELEERIKSREVAEELIEAMSAEEDVIIDRNFLE